MALEPDTVSLGGHRPPELEDMTRRFKVSLALTLLVAMSELLPGMPLHTAVGAGVLTWVQLVLATPVVLWGGWPFLVRGWNSVKTWKLNMFTLIGLGAAYAFSVVATVMPGIFPDSFRSHGGTVGVYFEAAAVITVLVLVLVGQLLELRARRQTSSALTSLLKLAPTAARRVRDDGGEDDGALDEGEAP